jgi:hypothetical protein
MRREHGRAQIALHAIVGIGVDQARRLLTGRVQTELGAGRQPEGVEVQGEVACLGRFELQPPLFAPVLRRGPGAAVVQPTLGKAERLVAERLHLAVAKRHACFAVERTVLGGQLGEIERRQADLFGLGE